MEGNPYSRMVAVFRGEASDQNRTGDTSEAGLGALPAKMRLGVVTQEVPLKIRVMGIEQPTEVLRVNECLTKGAKRETKITINESGYNTVFDDAEIEQMKIDLEVDDQVLLLTEDDQIFYILMKVVKAV